MDDVDLKLDNLGSPFRVILYKDAEQKQPVQEFLSSLDQKILPKVLRGISLLGEYGYSLRRPLVDKVKGDLYELRIQFARREIRILYVFFRRNCIILLSGLYKKTDKIPEGEIILAERRWRDWQYRYNKGEIEL